MRKILKRWAAELARDEGVAGLIIAMVISIIAFSALAVFFAKNSGTARDLARLQTANRGAGEMREAVFVHYLRQSPAALPCPDTDRDGDEDCTDTTGTASGTLPWTTLGLSRDAVLDPFGRYYTYVVLADSEARKVCTSVENDYESGEVEYTGSLKDQTTLEVRLTTASAGSGTYVPFAIISHGENGLGGISSQGTNMPNPVASSSEETNGDDVGPAVVYTGPSNSGAGTAYFDDVVIAPTIAEMQAVCEGQSPGQAMNASLSEDFTGTTFDTAKFATNGTGTAPTQTGGVAQFTATTSYLETASGYDFTPAVRPVYVSAYWTPSASPGGFSIATRATTTATEPAGDLFATNGITFRFYSTGTTGANSITIRENAATHATSSGTYTFTAGQQYLLEVFDNGDDAWARITQVSTPTNTAEVSVSNITSDTEGEQKVVLINGSGTNSIDNVLIGFPMLSLATGPSSGYAATAAAANGTGTGSITLEAWIRPRTLPGSGVAATIISQWDTSSPDNSSFRLYLLGSALKLDLNDAAGTGDAETFDLGISPTVNEWTHIAVSYDASSKSVRSYKSGVFANTSTSALENAGIQSATHRFAVGADSVNTSPANFFHGSTSDVRVWNDVRLSSEVGRCFQKRLPAAAPCNSDASLVANWKLNPTPAQGGFTETDAVAAAGTAGTLVSASYAPALAMYFRPISTDFCPSAAAVGVGGIPGTRSGAYQCEFRYVEQSTTTIGVALSIPSSLTTLYVKSWGGGGGGYDAGTPESSGGGGGFSEALLESISGTAVAGANIDVVVGAGGTGSVDANDGGGGGGASGIIRTSGTVNGLVAGGGGGAGYSDNAAAGCNATVGTATQCGIGGGGGGAGAAAAALTARAPDASGVCGGKGGDNTPSGADPTNATHCTQGGTDATTTAGGAGGGQAGGASAIGAGGSGYLGGTRIGSGGGGGGYPLGGEGGGYRNNADSGFGGGGGSGDANADAANVSGEASSVSGAASGAVDATRTGDIDHDHPTHKRRIDDITPSLTGDPWAVGDSISGVGIPVGAKIATIVNANAITIDMDPTASGNNVALTVTSAAGFVSVAGGDDDFDYAPDHLNDTTSLQTPGRGGIGGAVNGRAGAVILKW